MFHQRHSLDHFLHLYYLFSRSRSTHKFTKLLFFSLCLNLLFIFILVFLSRRSIFFRIIVVNFLLDLSFLRRHHFVLFHDNALLGQQFLQNKRSLTGKEVGGSEGKLITAFLIKWVSDLGDQLDQLYKFFVVHAAWKRVYYSRTA